jgi:hypothetical protein
MPSQILKYTFMNDEKDPRITNLLTEEKIRYAYHVKGKNGSVEIPPNKLH